MKKLSNASISGPKKLISKVLSKSPSSNACAKEADQDEEKKNLQLDLLLEVESLKAQLANLQLVVNAMHIDAEKKEQAIANLAREKEKLSCDLYKERRSNTNLRRQLEDERDFYYKEKEIYCREMNEYKKIKQRLLDRRECTKCKDQLVKLKQAVKHTLEVNYNLSVKFLRMKNTKFCLKARLKKLQASHDQILLECREKMAHMKDKLLDAVETQEKLPLHPSNKKYLQLVQQNGSLLHENMRLEIQADRLKLEVERLKMLALRKDTNSKLKYINGERNDANSYRQVEVPNVPNLILLDDVQFSHRKSSSPENDVEVGLQGQRGSFVKVSKNSENHREVVEKHIMLDSKVSVRVEKKKSVTYNFDCVKHDRIFNSAPSLSPSQPTLSNECESKSDARALSSIYSNSELSECSECAASRTQSAPEIVQTSHFVNTV